MQTHARREGNPGKSWEILPDGPTGGGFSWEILGNPPGWSDRRRIFLGNPGRSWKIQDFPGFTGQVPNATAGPGKKEIRPRRPAGPGGSDIIYFLWENKTGARIHLLEMKELWRHNSSSWGGGPAANPTSSCSPALGNLVQRSWK